jgi:hypothetical protein
MDCHDAERTKESIEASRGQFARGGFWAFNAKALYFGKEKKEEYKDKGERRA